MAVQGDLPIAGTLWQAYSGEPIKGGERTIETVLLVR